MEGDAGTRQLNPTDAEDTPDESVAVPEQEHSAQQNPTGRPPRSLTSMNADPRGWAAAGWSVSAPAC